LCVAGYVFTESGRVALERDWAALLAHDLRFFRASSCVAGRGVFKKYLDDEKHRDAIMRQAIDLIVAHATCGVALSIDMHFAHLLPDLDFWTSPYSMLCWQSLIAIMAWSVSVGYEKPIS
jgi:hypothetical protein